MATKLPDFDRYVLVPWPYYHDFEKEPGFEKHSLFVPSPSDVADPCFLEESWYLGVMETKNGLQL